VGRNRVLSGVLALMLVFSYFSFVPKAHAGTITFGTTLESNMVASGTSSLYVLFKTSSAGATTGSLNFGSWGGTVNGSQSITTTGCVALFASVDGGGLTINALPGGSLAASGTGSTINITSITALSATTAYCFNLTSASAVTNPGAGVYPITMTFGSDTDTTTVDVISGDTVTVSATVPQSFTLSLGASSDSFTGNLSATAFTATGGVTATINTNAVGGWSVYALDSQAGLRSTIQSHTISSVSTGSLANFTTDIGTEAYGLGVTTANKTTNYDDTGGHSAGGLSTSTLNAIAASTSAASAVSVTFKELADIQGTTQPASDYTDIITIVGAGSF